MKPADTTFNSIATAFIESQSQNIWKDLTMEENREYRQWARDNYTPGTEINILWHLAVKDECRKMNQPVKEEPKEENPFGEETETVF